MEAHTFPDPRVTRMINELMVPVQFNVVEDPGAMRRFQAHWTPCQMLQDGDGNEYRRSFGALTPEAFIAEFSLSRGLRFLHSGVYGKAYELIERALEYTFTIPEAHAENLYWLGVAKYRHSQNPDDLGIGWSMLRENHPDSSWARKTDFYFAD